MVAIFLGIFIAYLLGSVPTAYIFGRVLKNIDIREHGSGNVGATNVFRTVGKVQGIIALVLDFLKGLIAVVFIPIFIEKFSKISLKDYPVVFVLLGGAVVAGHIWTVFLKFKGGKGVATSAGVMAGLAPFVLLVSFAIWFCIFYFKRYVSVASIIAAASLPVVAAILNKDLYFIIFCSVLSVIAVYGHRSNIRRLFLGEEKKLL